MIEVGPLLPILKKLTPEHLARSEREREVKKNSRLKFCPFFPERLGRHENVSDFFFYFAYITWINSKPQN